MKEELIEIGLSEQEAEVYLQLLKERNQIANQLSKETKINRSVVYSILDKLLDKGLVNYVLIGSVKHFSASDPKILKDFLKEKEKLLVKLLPKLEDIKSKKREDIIVEVYQGLKGGIAVLKDIIREGEDYVSIGENKGFEQIPETIMQQYIRDINQKRIKERLLVKEGEIPIHAKNSEIRFLPKDFEFPSVTTVYGDKVVIAIFEKPYYTILIRSKQLADSYRSFFKGLWKISRKT